MREKSEKHADVNRIVVYIFNVYYVCALSKTSCYTNTITTTTSKLIINRNKDEKITQKFQNYKFSFSFFFFHKIKILRSSNDKLFMLPFNQAK